MASLADVRWPSTGGGSGLSSAVTGVDLPAELRSLHELRQSGRLDDVEYAAAKQAVLGVETPSSRRVRGCEGVQPPTSPTPRPRAGAAGYLTPTLSNSMPSGIAPSSTGRSTAPARPLRAPLKAPPALAAEPVPPATTTDALLEENATLKRYTTALAGADLPAAAAAADPVLLQHRLNLAESEIAENRSDLVVMQHKLAAAEAAAAAADGGVGNNKPPPTSPAPPPSVAVPVAPMMYIPPTNPAASAAAALLETPLRGGGGAVKTSLTPAARAQGASGVHGGGYLYSPGGGGGGATTAAFPSAASAAFSPSPDNNNNNNNNNNSYNNNSYNNTPAAAGAAVGMGASAPSHGNGKRPVMTPAPAITTVNVSASPSMDGRAASASVGRAGEDHAAAQRVCEDELARSRAREAALAAEVAELNAHVLQQAQLIAVLKRGYRTQGRPLVLEELPEELQAVMARAVAIAGAEDAVNNMLSAHTAPTSVGGEADAAGPSRISGIYSPPIAAGGGSVGGGGARSVSAGRSPSPQERGERRDYIHGLYQGDDFALATASRATSPVAAPAASRAVSPEPPLNADAMALPPGTMAYPVAFVDGLQADLRDLHAKIVLLEREAAVEEGQEVEIVRLSRRVELLEGDLQRANGRLAEQYEEVVAARARGRRETSPERQPSPPAGGGGSAPRSSRAPTTSPHRGAAWEYARDSPPRRSDKVRFEPPYTEYLAPPGAYGGGASAGHDPNFILEVDELKRQASARGYELRLLEQLDEHGTPRRAAAAGEGALAAAASPRRLALLLEDVSNYNLLRRKLAVGGQAAALRHLALKRFATWYKWILFREIARLQQHTWDLQTGGGGEDSSGALPYEALQRNLMRSERRRAELESALASLEERMSAAEANGGGRHRAPRDESADDAPPPPSAPLPRTSSPLPTHEGRDADTAWL